MPSEINAGGFNHWSCFSALMAVYQVAAQLDAFFRTVFALELRTGSEGLN